ncbi:MAG: hypothetical protein ABI169_16780, partial [Chitinophagaceae bacterium]
MTLADPKKRRAIYELLLLDYAAAVLAWLLFWMYRHWLLGYASLDHVFTVFGPRDWVMGLLLVPCGWVLLYALSGTYFDL